MVREDSGLVSTHNPNRSSTCMTTSTSTIFNLGIWAKSIVQRSPRRCDPPYLGTGTRNRSQVHPIITVGRPITITPPCTVWSPIRAAGRFPIKTVSEPIAIESGGPTQVHMSVARAAGWPPINTVGQPGGKIGPPTCGIGGTPGVCIGQVCMSPTLAAGGMACFGFHCPSGEGLLFRV
jgi:hypothetical protein